MRYFLTILILLFGLVAPGTVFYYFSPWGIRPDVLMIWVIYFSLHTAYRPALVLAFVTGLTADFYMGSAVGQYALTYCAVALVSVWLQKRWDQDNIPSVVMLAAAVSFMGQTVLALLAALAGFGGSLGAAAKMVCGVSLYNAALALLTYPVLHRSFTRGCLHKFAKFDHME